MHFWSTWLIKDLNQNTVICILLWSLYFEINLIESVSVAKTNLYPMLMLHSSVVVIPCSNIELFQRLSETSEILSVTDYWLHFPQQTENYLVQVMAQKVCYFCVAAGGFFPFQSVYSCQSIINKGSSNACHICTPPHSLLQFCFLEHLRFSVCT